MKGRLKMTRARFKFRRNLGAASAGFSLAEILVGMVIAMLGILVMTQVFSLSEGQKRTTTGGDDAQNSGAIALYGLQRDIRQAGWGITNSKVMGCNILIRAGLTINSVGPVTINHPQIPAGDTNTDTLLIVTGSTNGSTDGDGITAQPAVNQYSVQTSTSFNNGDKVLATPQVRATPCALSVTSITSVASPNVTVGAGVAAMANGALYNLGRKLGVTAYRIKGGDLVQCDLMDAAVDCTAATNPGWLKIANNIVSMRAQYGRDTDTPMDGRVNANGWDQTLPATACEWLKASAIRFALVARSGLLEKTVVSVGTTGNPNGPAWEGSAATGSSTGAGAVAPTDLSADASWQNYRYKVFQTVVPLRNTSWVGVQSGC
jgi:type IV pilus assembly protein PilW